MHFDLKEISSATMILFAVIDIIGSIPVILDLRKKFGHIHSEKITLVSCSIMLVFLFLGKEILNLIGISVYSFAVAGSFVIFFLSLEMILGITLYKHENVGSGAIVPLAFPIIVGTGTLTSLLSLHAEFKVQNIIVAILLNLILIYLVLKFSKIIEKILGNQGISVLRKIFGVVLLAISVKLFASNIKELFR